MSPQRSSERGFGLFVSVDGPSGAGHAIACLYAADRYHHVETEIQPLLKLVTSWCPTATSPPDSWCSASTASTPCTCGSSTTRQPGACGLRLQEVVTGLLGLPEPGQSGAPSLVKRSSLLWTPR